MTRPGCVVDAWDLAGEKRPRFTPTPGVAAVVRNLGDTAGLRQMGVHLRSIQPGDAGTNRHFHTVEEEWAYVLSGNGAVRIGPHRMPVRPGSFVGFVPGPRPHHFLAKGGDPLVILEGGERRPQEDVGCYVDIPRWWHLGGKVLEKNEAPPPEEGERTQHIHLDDLVDYTYKHDVDATARRMMRLVGVATGLTRQSVVWARVEPGAHSTAFHTHDRTDEWVFILEGRASVRLGDQRFEVGPYDFVGHPAGGPPHLMEPVETLTYLMGGQIDAEDSVVYPDARVRRVHGVIEPI